MQPHVFFQRSVASKRRKTKESLKTKPLARLKFLSDGFLFSASSPGAHTARAAITKRKTEINKAAVNTHSLHRSRVHFIAHRHSPAVPFIV
jgi:hypothetical protein